MLQAVEPRRYEARGACRELWRINSTREVLLEGPAGCVAGETLLWDPIAERARRFDDLCWTATRPWVQTLRGSVRAEAPFLKGFAPLYRVTLESGLSCLATADHLFLSDNGWRRTDCLASGMALLSTRDGGARRWTRTAQDSQAGCHHGSRCDGVRLLGDRAADQAPTPSRADARGRSRADSRAGAQAVAAGRSPTCRSGDRPSIQDSARRSLRAPSDANPEAACATLHAGSRADRGSAERGVSPYRCDDRSRRALLLPQQGERRDRGFESTLTFQEDDPCAHGSACRDRIKSICYERDDFYYDLHVPGAEHYLADGIYSHNTGKTRSGLQWLDSLCWQYPWLRVALVREYRADFKNTALPILENEVYFPGHPALSSSNRDKEHRTEYRYPNGAAIDVFGVQNISGVMGAQYDVIYFVEATETTQEKWEMLRSRSLGRRRDQSNERVAKIDYSVMVAEVNPDDEGHYFNQWADEGKMQRLVTRHRDNPTLDGEWGVTYMAKLAENVGVRRDRYYLGLWRSATGLIFPQWNRSRHVVDENTIGPRAIPKLDEFDAFLGALDWGKRDAGVITMFGIKQRVPTLMQAGRVEYTKRAWRIEHTYQAEKSLEWWKDEIVRYWLRYKPWWIYADPGRPDLIEHMNAMLAPHCGRDPVSDPVVVGADNTKQPRAGDKGDMVGLDLLGWALNDAKDGWPRLLFRRDSLSGGPDKALLQARRKWTLEEEIRSYAWKKIKDGGRIREVPEDGDDHELDATRYLVSGFFRLDFRSYTKPAKFEMELVRPEHRSFARMVEKHGYEYFKNDVRFARFDVKHEAPYVDSGANPQLAEDIDDAD